MYCDTAEAVAAFKATWEAVLQKVLGWHEEQAKLWSYQHEWMFEDAYFLYDPPIHALASVLIPKGLWNRVTWHQVEQSLTPERQWHPDQDPDFDWASAKQRLEDLLQEGT